MGAKDLLVTLKIQIDFSLLAKLSLKHRNVLFQTFLFGRETIMISSSSSLTKIGHRLSPFVWPCRVNKSQTTSDFLIDQIIRHSFMDFDA